MAQEVPLGSLVKVDGSFAQVVDYFPDERSYSVAKVNGESRRAAPSDLEVPADLGRPGQGGPPESFDVLVGPRLVPDVLGEEIGACIMEKGFCVLRVCQDSQRVSAAVECMRSLGQESPSKLRRLPEEVEPDYLGTGGRGKVAWMDAGSTVKDATLKANDEFLSRLVFKIMPHTLNSLGKVAEDRTPALVSLSLLPGEEAEYPHPVAEPEALAKCLKTWQRSLLKAVHFMGPGTATITLDSSGDEDLPISVDSVTIAAVPNTILLYRTKCFDCRCRMDKETLSMMTQFMERDVRLQPMTDALAQLDLSTMDLPGSKPPSAERCTVHNTATRLMMNWDDSDAYAWGLAKGGDAAVQMPISRFDVAAYFNPDPTTQMPWNMIFQHMSFCEGLENFDHSYFNIPKGEALGMDPMHRHLLETGAMNLHKMGITKKFADRNPHHAGCAVGLDKDDWATAGIPKDRAVEEAGGQNVQAIISNRFNYTFNMKGASFVADTACSASLSCTHLATIMLENRRTDKLEFFICAGLHQCHTPGIWIGMSQSHMASTIGRCLTFNETADGYMRGDGCSALTLKYNEPNKEKEAIWRGSMVGQNGRSATLTAPNGLAQEDVIWKALREADISPAECSVWSCHGTGTNLGDPIEVGGIRKVMLQANRDTSLMIGTNKTNTGHLEGGAAMTSLIAAVFQVKGQYANPLNHGHTLNAYLELNNFEAFFNYEYGSTNLHQSHVDVSSFGFGGTNAHAVMWADNKFVADSPKKFWHKQLSQMAPPEIRAIGTDPSQWISDLPEAPQPGDIWSVTVQKGDLKGSIKWEKTEEGLGDDYDPDDVSYSIVGSFNDWKPEALEDGDVPGLRNIVVDVPESGKVEFRFVQSVDDDMILAPSSDFCSKKTQTIVGPAKDLKNKWVARGIGGSSLKISLFTSYKRYAVSWMNC